MICIKSGVGWKTYSNCCFALKDCSLMRTFHPPDSGPVFEPVSLELN